MDVDINKSFVFFAARKLLAKNPLKPEYKYATKSIGTHFHAAKNSFENSMLPINFESRISNEQTSTFTKL